MTRQRILRVAVYFCVTFAVVGGLYLARCWQLMAGVKLVESGYTWDVYNDNFVFWLSPAFSGEPHWHLNSRDDSGELHCFHGWRRAALWPEVLPRLDQMPTGYLDTLTKSCRFTQHSEVYGDIVWTDY